MRNFCLLLICFLLAACAPASSQAPIIEEAGMSRQELRTELAKIAGAQITEGDSLVVSFPTGTLFATGSALPMPGGIDPLDALATVMKQSGLSWSLKVRAASGEGELYDSELAAIRAKILRTYFKNSGLNTQLISIIALAEPGAPLELKPISAGD